MTITEKTQIAAVINTIAATLADFFTANPGDLPSNNSAWGRQVMAEFRSMRPDLDALIERSGGERKFRRDTAEAVRGHVLRHLGR